jgi:hypothetical protein
MWESSFQKYNRFFDSISIRYLFYNGEELDLYPKSDKLASGIKVTNETGRTNTLDAGVSGNPTTTISPNLSVHAQRNFKLVYQRNMNSWRMGLSFEPCEFFSSVSSTSRS